MAPVSRGTARLLGYDYRSAGAYFLTLCTHDKACLFGEVVKGEMELSELGRIIEAEWFRTPDVRPEVTLDAFVVMPNHVHGIVMLSDRSHPVGAHGRAPVAGHLSSRGSTLPDAEAPMPTDSPYPGDPRAHGPFGSTQGGRAPLRRPSRSLGAFVAGLKASATRRINERRRTPGMPVWQRNYHEHVVRDEEDLRRIREYIVSNPFRWSDDENNPANIERMNISP